MQSSNSNDNEKFLDKLYQLLGQIASGFAGLEYELNNSFALAVNDSYLDIGLCISDQLSYNQVVQLFENIAKQSTIEHSERFLERLELLIRDLKEAAKLRNDSLHSSYGYVMGSNRLFIKTTSRIRKKIKKGRSTFVDPIPDLNNALERISKTLDDLLDFTRDYL